MASLYDTSANSALNEDKYINKLYDSTLDSQKKALQQGYDNSVKQLTTGQQNTQQQTNDYVKRAYTEGVKANANVQKSAAALPSGAGSSAQSRLTMANQQQANVTALKNQQSVADMEYEQLRQLLADQYASQIKQAQADNDMNRAQALYEAAKAEEEQLRGFRQTAGTLMQSKDDNSIIDAIARGDAVQRDTTSETWDSVLKNEESINKIYDAQIESARQEAQMAYAQELSELEAQQQAAMRETDKNLTNAYVDALKKSQNYQEVQNAYGQGSGASARARLAREAGLTEKLTNLRALQIGKDVKAEQEKAELVRVLGGKIADAQSSADLKRVQALYDAAEKEEQALISEQQTIGDLLAKQNDYSVLGKLYGLTPEQINLLQGGGSGGGSGGYRYSGGSGGGGSSVSSSGQTVGANSSIISLGQGPISSANLQSQVASGNVTALTNNGKVTYVSTPKSPSGNIAGAAMKSASASSKAGSLGSVVSKVASAAKSLLSKK